MKRLFAGIDLHSNNVVIGIVDENGHRLKHQKLECDLKKITHFSNRGKNSSRASQWNRCTIGIWLVDGLIGQGYPTQLADPAQIEQYNGIKHAAK